MRIARLYPRVVRAAVVVWMCTGTCAFAQDPPAPEPAPEIVPLPAAALLPVQRLDADARQSQTAIVWRPAPPEPKRPAALVPLYGSLIALQALDLHSSRRALANGSSYEANPAMSPIVRNSAAFVAVKAAATGGVIWISERLWKRQPKKALVFTALVNAAMGTVVANNYRLQMQK